MKLLLLTSVVLASLSFGAIAQDQPSSSSSAESIAAEASSSSEQQTQTANVDPNQLTPEIQSVVGVCTLVRNTEKDNPNPNSGKCIGATQSYLDGLKAQTPALPSDAFDQNITNLVLALVPLAQQDESCTAFDDEIAQAVKLASTYALSNDQKTQLSDIATTVAACQKDQTAALPEAIPPSGA